MTGKGHDCPSRHKKRRSAFLQSRHNQDTSNHFEKLRSNLEGFHSIGGNK
jgi:plasmid maintenance system killer protein